MEKRVLSFNAANLSPEEVAENFIYPEVAKGFFEFKHFILLGPRGVGKTTLMKTLTAQGLHSLHKRGFAAEGFDPLSIDYMPIYIRADALWKGTAHFFSKVIEDDELRERILNGIFVYHCIREMVAALENGVEVGENYGESAPTWALSISDQQEEKIARICSEIWAFDKIQTSFLGLKLAALKRLNLYRSAINALDSSKAIEEVRQIDSLDITIVLKGFVDVLQKFTGIQRWSISFDEMEIAPKRVVALLYENMRGYDPRIALKFSLYPYVDFYSQVDFQRSAETGPVHGQDFNAVSLTHKFSNPDTQFSKKLVAAECKKRGVQFYELKNYMNNSHAIHKGTRVFKDNSTERNHEKIVDFVVTKTSDRSLKEYYSRRQLDKPEILNSLSENQKAALVRKVAPLAEFRSYYFSRSMHNDQNTRRSSVKGFGYYHGFEQLLVLSEGIPRVLLQHTNEIIDAMIRGDSSGPAQNRAVRSTLDRYRALVATQVVQVHGNIELYENALSLTDAVGRENADLALSKDFSVHPYLSFQFSKLPRFQRRLVEIAVSTGAFVPDTDQEESGKILFKVEDVRLRISYRLAAFYPLPLITGRMRSISNNPTSAEKMEQADLLSWEQGND